MAILLPTVLAAAWDSVDRTSYTTASLAVLPGRALVLWVDTSIAAGSAPGVSPSNSVLTPGCIWSAENNVAWPTDVRHGFVFTAPCGTGPVPGTMALAMTNRGSGTTSTGTGWAVLQFPPGVNVADIAIAAPVNSINAGGLTITLARPYCGIDRWVVFFSHRANEVTTPRAAPWSEISDVAGASPSRGADVQWLPNATSGTTVGVLETLASATWSTSSQAGGLAVEMRALPIHPQMVGRYYMRAGSR